MHRPRLSLPVLLAALLVTLLGACTGSGVDTSGLAPLTSETEDMRAAPLAAPEESAAFMPAAPASASPPLQPASATAAVGNARLDFAPVIGASEAALRPLAARLTAGAGQRGIPLAEGGGATHLVRGYFSAFTEGRETTIVYVWDVIDAAGIRVHRIQGRQSLPSGSQQGWKSVTPATMETIADRTMDDLALWLTGTAG